MQKKYIVMATHAPYKDIIQAYGVNPLECIVVDKHNYHKLLGLVPCGMKVLRFHRFAKHNVDDIAPISADSSAARNVRYQLIEECKRSYL